MCYLEPIPRFNQERWKALHQLEVLTRCRNHLEIFTIGKEIEAASLEFGAAVVLCQLQHRDHIVYRNSVATQLVLTDLL